MINRKTGLWARVLVLLLVLGVVFGAPLHQEVSGQAQHRVYLPMIFNGPHLVYLPIILVPVPEPEPVPPAFSTSLYMGSVDPAIAYNLGCAAGQADLAAPGKQDTLIILAFGQPWVEDYVYGIWNFSGPFASNAQVGLAVREFGHGYWACTGSDTASHITLGIGTSNYGSYFDDGKSCTSRAACARTHGEKWAQLVADTDAWLTAQGYAGQVTVAGANDIEQSWNRPEASTPWVEGFDAYDQNRYVFYNFGSCSNCPTRLDNTLVPPNGWTPASIYYVSYGVRPAWPIPEIYANSGVNARQWAYLSYLSVVNSWGGPMYFPGLMTEWQACNQFPAGCDLIDNTPQEGYNQLHSELAYWPATAQAVIPWLTDIKWTTRLPTAAENPLAEVGLAAGADALPTWLANINTPAAGSLLQEKLTMLTAQQARQTLAAQNAPSKPDNPLSAAPASIPAARPAAGIRTQGRPPLSALQVEVNNHWAGDVNGELTLVFGGWQPANPEQGVVVWYRPDSGELYLIPAPQPTGGLTVTTADEGLITLQDAQSNPWLFDALTGTWR